jgi:uncharacterized protein
MNFRKIILTLILIITIMMTLVVFFANQIIPKLVFRPVVLEDSYEYDFSGPYISFYLYPDADIKTEVVRFSVENPKGAILYFHGNTGNLQRWGIIAEKLTVYQYDVYVLDYRGYGKSTGVPTEYGLLCDAEKLIEYIQQNHDYDKLIYFGRSLGSGVAAWLTEKYCPDGLILETPYYSLENLITSYYPLYSHESENRISFPSWQYLSYSNTKILMLHGTEDKVIPVEEAIKLYETVKDQHHVKFVIIPKGTHDNLSVFPEYIKALNDFLL